jgi:hypothetical protein
VFDPRLARRIHQVQDGRSPKSSAQRHNGPLVERSRMQGAQWLSYVRLGNQCFEIIEGDPLDELSRDQWYSVSCEN